jgi:pimeloyl-ACP methyl ester carboxylesterase
VAGASFGGLICMKLAIVAPEKVKSVVLLNPGCLQPFSLSFKNLYYNLLPIIKPTEKNVSKFLDKAIFCKPSHEMSAFAERMLVDYEVFAITRYKDNTQKPYFMGSELEKTEAPVHVLLGDKDLLFPFQKSIENAKRFIKNLREVKVYPNVGHGIETYAPAIQKVREIIENNP